MKFNERSTIMCLRNARSRNDNQTGSADQLRQSERAVLGGVAEAGSSSPGGNDLSGLKYTVNKGKTPVVNTDEARE